MKTIKGSQWEQQKKVQIKKSLNGLSSRGKERINSPERRSLKVIQMGIQKVKYRNTENTTSRKLQLIIT